VRQAQAREEEDLRQARSRDLRLQAPERGHQAPEGEAEDLPEAGEADRQEEEEVEGRKVAAKSVVGPAAVGGVVLVTVLLRGGFFPAGQAVFVALAGGAFAFAAFRDERATLAALRRPPVAVLGAIGLLTFASALWTIGPAGDPLRAGLVAFAAAALVAASAVLCRGARGAAGLAVALAIVAGLAALLGLAGVVVRAEPWAERVAGSWRPGGPFEYSPALALLQVSALPALLVGMVSRRGGLAVAAAVGAVLAAATIGLSDSRLQVALAAAIVLTAIALPRQTLGAERRAALGAAVLLVAVGVAVEVLLGGYAKPGIGRGDGGRLLELALVVAGAAALWAVAVGRLRGDGAGDAGVALARVSWRPILAAMVLAALVAAVAVDAPVQGSTDFAHGRLDLWGVAVDAAADRPLLGAGGETFLQATHQLQDGDAIRFAHSLPLEWATELGVLGFALALALYATCLTALARAPDERTLWLLGPAVAAFLVTSLVDWQWHFAASLAVFAAALGPLLVRERA
jgi:hypothetical protein